MRQSQIIIRRDYGKANVVLTSSDNKSGSSSFAKQRKRSKLDSTRSEIATSTMQSNGGDFVIASNVETRNSFDSLADITDEIIVNNGESQNKAHNQKRIRCPPITVFGKNSKDLYTFLKLNKIPDPKYHLKGFKGGVSIYAADVDTFRVVVDVLKSHEWQFFSHQISSEVPIKVVLTGLPLFEIDELKQELLEHKLVPLEVKVLSAKNSEYVLYLLHFSNGSVKLQHLQKVKALFNTIVKWRYFSRKSMEALQCYRCQKFGHGASNCNLLPLCVKCGEKHLTNQCKLLPKMTDGDESRSHIKCANCSGNHTANYRGCPSRKRYLEDMQKKKEMQAGSKSRKTTPPLRRQDFRQLPTQLSVAHDANPIYHPNRPSYSQVLQQPSRPVVTQPAQSSCESTPNPDIFTISEFLCLARDLFVRLSACKSKQEQFMALSELMIKYIYHG